MQLRAILLFAIILPGAFPAAAESPRPFALRIIDDQTQRGVPLVELKTVSNVSFYTDSAGYAAIDDPALLSHKVFFYVASHGYEYPPDGFGLHGTAIDLTPGGEATWKIMRLNIAERLYRITGEGIYCDSAILGKRVPTTRPLINAEIVGQDSVQRVIYKGKIRWFWGDTNRQSYPLGHFSMAGATSDLPGEGGLNPSAGINLEYFVDKNGFSRPMVPPSGAELHWFGGLATLKDDKGQERMIATLLRLKSMEKPLGRELIVYDDAKDLFQTLKVLDLKSPGRLSGHPFRHTVDGVEYFYCGESAFPNVRVKADWASVTDPAAYEAYVPQERDAQGKLAWAWQKGATPLDVEEQERRIKAGKMKAEETPFRLRDAQSKQFVRAHAGTVCWNEFCRKWVMIAVEQFGKPSMLGEVWYALADAPEGPWRDARRIVTHDRYSFYNPAQHPFFDQKGGRFIYFEGTYTTTFSRQGEPTPRYDYNQIMYRLDLSDPRLQAP